MATKKAVHRAKGKPATTYTALLLVQRPEPAPKLILFHASVKEVLAWGTVEWLTPKSKGPQREQRETKVKAIRDFLEVDDQNTVPTGVVVAFAEGAAKVSKRADSDAVKLTIKPTGTAIASIVDGQHRLYGMNEYDSDIRVPVLGILDADSVERAFQFLVINNKATKVPPRHTKALLAEMSNTDLPERLASAKVAFDAEGISDVDLVNTDKESPFFNSIEWTTTPKDKRIIQATAIEMSLDYLAGLQVPDLADRDDRRAVFLAIWTTIKAEWPKLWVRDSRLISKVGIFCLTRFVVDRLTSWSDSDDLEINITDLSQVKKLTKRLIRHMDTLFWTHRWADKAKGGFDTSQGRERVYSAIVQLYRNGKNNQPWFTNIDIINKSDGG